MASLNYVKCVSTKYFVLFSDFEQANSAPGTEHFRAGLVFSGLIPSLMLYTHIINISPDNFEFKDISVIPTSGDLLPMLKTKEKVYFIRSHQVHFYPKPKITSNTGTSKTGNYILQNSTWHKVFVSESLMISKYQPSLVILILILYTCIQ